MINSSQKYDCNNTNECKQMMIVKISEVHCDEISSLNNALVYMLFQHYLDILMLEIHIWASNYFVGKFRNSKLTK